MEKFKADMRKQDGVPSNATAHPESQATSSSATLLPSASFSSATSEPDYGNAEVGNTSGRQKSRFGGRFFRLDDEEDLKTHRDTINTSHVEPLPVLHNSHIDSLHTLNSLATELPVLNHGSRDTSKPAPSTPVRNVPVVTQTPPSQKKFSFNAGVPTSVMRKMSSTVDVKVELSSDKRNVVPQVDSSLKGVSALEQQSIHIMDSFGGPFGTIPNSRNGSKTVSPGSSRTSPILSPGRTSPIGPIGGMPGQPVPAMMEPIVHVGPDGQKMELPPPHIFVQMLLANNMPVPPELMAFLPPQMMGGFIPTQQASQAYQVPQMPPNMMPNQHVQTPQSIFPMGPSAGAPPNLLSQLFGGQPQNVGGSGVRGQTQHTAGKVYTLEDIEKMQ